MFFSTVLISLSCKCQLGGVLTLARCFVFISKDFFFSYKISSSLIFLRLSYEKYVIV